MPSLQNASPEMDNTSKKNTFALIQAGLDFVNENKEVLHIIAKKLIRYK